MEIRVGKIRANFNVDIEVTDYAFNNQDIDWSTGKTEYQKRHDESADTAKASVNLTYEAEDLSLTCAPEELEQIFTDLNKTVKDEVRRQLRDNNSHRHHRKHNNNRNRRNIPTATPMTTQGGSKSEPKGCY